MKLPCRGAERAKARFAREVELAAKLEHPHIARIYDSGVHHQAYFYAMELVRGLPLDQYVALCRPTQSRILELMGQICLAVEFAHRKGIIHRDLKPGNIMVDEAGQPRVLDFGLAKALSKGPLAGGGTLSLGAEPITIQGEVAGSRGFMSPEQAAGHVECLDERSDVYSLGLILFLLLTGRLPNNADVREETWSQDERGAVAPALREAIRKATALAPEQRHSSAADFAADLGGVDVRKTSWMPRILTKRTDRRRAVAAGVVVMVGMAAVIALAAERWRGEVSLGTAVRPELARAETAGERTLPAKSRVTLPTGLAELPVGRVLQMAYESAPPSPEGAPGSGLMQPRLQAGLAARRSGQKAFAPLRDGQELTSVADEYLIAARAVTAGYLYVFQVDASGHIDWLFPENPYSAFSSGGNPLSAGQIVQVPPKVGGKVLTLDRITGVEHVYFVFSATRWGELESALAAPTTTQPSPSLSQLAVRGAARELGNGIGIVQAPNHLGLRGVGEVKASEQGPPELDLMGLFATPVPESGSGSATIVTDVKAAQNAQPVVVIERHFKHVSGD